MPMISGGTPRLAKLTKRASGFRSNCLTAFSLARMSAPALTPRSRVLAVAMTLKPWAA